MCRTCIVLTRPFSLGHCPSPNPMSLRGVLKPIIKNSSEIFPSANCGGRAKIAGISRIFCCADRPRPRGPGRFSRGKQRCPPGFRAAVVGNSIPASPLKLKGFRSNVLRRGRVLVCPKSGERSACMKTLSIGPRRRTMPQASAPRSCALSLAGKER